MGPTNFHEGYGMAASRTDFFNQVARYLWITKFFNVCQGHAVSLPVCNTWLFIGPFYAGLVVIFGTDSENPQPEKREVQIVRCNDEGFARLRYRSFYEAVLKDTFYKIINTT